MILNYVCVCVRVLTVDNYVHFTVKCSGVITSCNMRGLFEPVFAKVEWNEKNEDWREKEWTLKHFVYAYNGIKYK